MNILIKILSLAIGLYVMALIMPGALVAFAGANLSGVDDGVVTIFQILVPLIGVVAGALYFVSDIA